MAGSVIDTQCNPSFLCACPVQSLSDGLLGGHQTRIADSQLVGSIADQPWSAIIKNAGSTPASFSSGAIVSALFVLTVGHTMYEVDKTKISVQYGTLRRNLAPICGTEVGVANIAVHPGFSLNGKPVVNDLAVIELAAAILFNNFGGCVKAIALPTTEIPPNGAYWMYGYGSKDDVLGTLGVDTLVRNCLQKAGVVVIPTDTCNSTYTSNTPYIIQPGTICVAGPPGTHTTACNGDSGGGVVSKTGGEGTLYGLTSWGKGCGDITYPTNCVSIYYNLVFINQEITRP